MAMWRYLLTAGLLVSMLSFSRAGERIESIYMAGERPEGLYTSVSQFKPDVCQPVLDSLNKSFSISNQNRADYPRYTAQPDLFLTSDLQLPWTLRLVSRPDAPEVDAERLEFAPANVGGRSVILYRRSFDVAHSTSSTLPVNSLTISNTRLPPTPAGRRLNSQVLKSIRGNEISLDDEKLQLTNSAVNVAMPRGRRSVNSYFLLNAVAVAGETFVLAINAAEADESAPREIDGSVNLYVLQLHSAANIRLVCHFVGR
jgi:hypothetical protein